MLSKGCKLLSLTDWQTQVKEQEIEQIILIRQELYEEMPSESNWPMGQREWRLGNFTMAKCPSRFVHLILQQHSL
jgi:hypothetical protein